MPRPATINELNGMDKHALFKTAYDYLNEYIKKGEYLAAHALAFSILEDRVLAARIDCESLNGNQLKGNIKLNKIPFSASVHRLLELKVIEKQDAENLLAAATERNELMHQAMWRLNEFNRASILNLRKLINRVKTCHKAAPKKFNTIKSA